MWRKFYGGPLSAKLKSEGCPFPDWGWVAYIHYRNGARSLLRVKAHAEQWVRIHLYSQIVRHRLAGYARFPARRLYEDYGLFKVPSGSGLEEGACPAVKNIGKPCAGKPHLLFD
jgi:hypothetical protein